MVAKRRVIGVDESGKGDFFGPLVIAAFLAADSDLDLLQELGVRDSKLIADKKLLGIDEQLRLSFPHAVIIYTPEEYNQRYAYIKNLNKLLAEGHARAVAAILAEYRADLVISDKFGKPELVEKTLRKKGVTIDLQQLVRGEQILQVGAASILARAAFIREIARLSALLEMDIPRGAGSIVDEAGNRLTQHNPISIFNKIAKTHFRNYRRIVNLTLPVK